MPAATTSPAESRHTAVPTITDIFFPAGELAKFKTAQNAKVTYHKLWNIPLPSVSNVLLAAVAVIMIGSITAITISIQKNKRPSPRPKNCSFPTTHFLRPMELSLSRQRRVPRLCHGFHPLCQTRPDPHGITKSHDPYDLRHHPAPGHL